MTNKEAIRRITNLQRSLWITTKADVEDFKALELAIEILKKKEEES